MHRNIICSVKKVKWSRYRPGVAQRVGRGIALLFHDRGTRRGWVVSSTPRPHFTPVKDPVPIVQEAGWAPGPVWTGGKSRPDRDSIPNRPARSQSLHRLSCPAHLYVQCKILKLYSHTQLSNLTVHVCRVRTVTQVHSCLLCMYAQPYQTQTHDCACQDIIFRLAITTTPFISHCTNGL